MDKQYINLLSEALYKINKMAKVSRDYWYWYDMDKISDLYYNNNFSKKMKFNQFLLIDASSHIDDEEIAFCVEYGDFYKLKDQVLCKVNSLGLLTFIGIHKFPNCNYSLYKFGNHTFHSTEIYFNPKYKADKGNHTPKILGNIDKPISSKCHSRMPYMEAMNIVEDFLNDTNIYMDEILEEKYSA